MDLTEEFQPSSTRNTFENTCQLPAQKLPRFNLNSRFHFGIEQDITITNFVLHQHYVSNIITAVTLLVLGGIKCNLSIIKIATLSDPRFSLTMSDSNMNAVTQQGGGDVEAVDEEKYFEAKLVLKQQPRSPYWPFFKFVGTKLKGTDGKTLHCMLCLESQDERMKKKTIAYGGGTACIKYHMERYHKEKLEASIEEEGSMKGQTSLLNFAVQKPSNSIKKWPKSSQRWIDATKDLAVWVTASSRSIGIVEDEGFINYSRRLNPEYEVPCAKTISNYIEKDYIKEKENLINDLDKIEFVACSTDGGSSTNAVSYQDINVHYINDKWDLKSSTLAVRQNKGEHTADRYREITDEVLDEYGLSGKVVLTVTDNEPKMCKSFPDSERSGCCAHIIHSTTSAGLSQVETIKDVTGKTSKVCTKHNKSCVFRSEVEKEQAAANLKQRPLIQDVEHRWGSVKASTESFLNHKDDADKEEFANFEAVNAALRGLKPKTKADKEKIQKLIFSLDEMVVVKNLHKFLKSLDVYATNLGGNFYVTSSVVIPTLKSIEHHLKPNMNDPRYIADIKRIMLSDLLERMKKNINFPFMIKASALDPRFKKLKFIPSAQREAVFNSLKLEADLAFYGKDVGSSQDSSKNEEDDNKPAKKQRVEVNYDISDSDEEEEDTSQSNVTKEIERYKKEEQNPEADPLAWWREREKSYPILSRLAKRILCVPATSVEAERRFSDLGLLLTKRRLCLTGPHVDMMLFLKDKHRKDKK